jgi:hypothetical protein
MIFLMPEKSSSLAVLVPSYISLWNEWKHIISLHFAPIRYMHYICPNPDHMHTTPTAQTHRFRLCRTLSAVALMKCMHFEQLQEQLLMKWGKIYESIAQ